jgi:hypothetical protein
LVSFHEGVSSQNKAIDQNYFCNISGMYHHSPASGLESGTASITDFYRPDEVKYHGKGNRGVVTMNFFGKKKFI